MLLLHVLVCQILQVLGLFAHPFNLFLLGAFVPGEEVSFDIWILLSNHIHKAIWKSLAVAMYTYLKDIETVPPAHAPTFLGGWQFVEGVCNACIIIKASAHIIKISCRSW